jgi:SAM-dependent methyltransferase
MTSAPARYFGRRARGYLEASGKGLWGRLRAAEWAAIRACLDLRAGLDVLDAGCGPGYYSLRLRDETGARVSGLDVSPAMIEAYRAQGFKGALACLETFRTAARYDRILIAGVLEFTRDPELALANMAGLLRGNGLIVCLVPAGGAAGAAYGAVHRLLGCPAFIRPPARYIALAKKAGLEPLRSSAPTPISRVFAFRRSGND